MAYLPIEDHGFIGDLHTAALGGIEGTVDWLCLPRFDAPSVFAAKYGVVGFPGNGKLVCSPERPDNARTEGLPSSRSHDAEGPPWARVEEGGE